MRQCGCQFIVYIYILLLRICVWSGFLCAMNVLSDFMCYTSCDMMSVSTLHANFTLL